MGDLLLNNVGNVMRKCIRSGDSDRAFRCGGDEFAVILEGAGVGPARRVAERLQSEFSAIDTYGTTMSIGIAAYAEVASLQRPVI